MSIPYAINIIVDSVHGNALRKLAFQKFASETPQIRVLKKIPANIVSVITDIMIALITIENATSQSLRWFVHITHNSHFQKLLKE